MSIAKFLLGALEVTASALVAVAEQRAQEDKVLAEADEIRARRNGFSLSWGESERASLRNGAEKHRNLAALYSRDADRAAYRSATYYRFKALEAEEMAKASELDKKRWAL